VIPALLLELLIIIQCNMAGSILFSNNSGQFLHAGPAGRSCSGCSCSHCGGTDTRGRLRIPLLPPARTPTPRCRRAAPRNVAARAYERVLCVSVTIASRARPRVSTWMKVRS